MYDDEMIFQLVSAPSDHDSLMLQVAVNRVPRANGAATCRQCGWLNRGFNTCKLVTALVVKYYLGFR